MRGFLCFEAPLARAVLLVSLSGAASACGSPSPRPTAPDDPDSLAPSRAMVQLRRGERSVGSLVDRERGLVHVLFVSDPSDTDPRRGPDGIVRVAERLCGGALDAAIERFDADLSMRNDDPTDEPVFECEGRVCRHRARMEFDVEGEYAFASTGPLVLERVVQVEGHLDEATDAEARRWVAEELAQLANGRCPSADGPG